MLGIPLVLDVFENGSKGKAQTTERMTGDFERASSDSTGINGGPHVPRAFTVKQPEKLNMFNPLYYFRFRMNFFLFPFQVKNPFMREFS